VPDDKKHRVLHQCREAAAALEKHVVVGYMSPCARYAYFVLPLNQFTLAEAIMT
jgi:hypothetical protein